MYFSQLWKLEVRDQGGSRVGSDEDPLQGYGWLLVSEQERRPGGKGERGRERGDPPPGPRTLLRAPIPLMGAPPSC